MDEKLRQRFRVLFAEIIAGSAEGRRLPKEKAFMIGGIGKAKAHKPNPGWRGWYFRDGNEHFVTHFTGKAETDHDKEWAVANGAKSEHLNKKRPQQQPRTP